jgi:predicted MPP superfamily phosphohydrolase
MSALPYWLARLILFSVLGLILVSQIFWFWRAHRFLRSRQRTWLRWLLAVPVYLFFLGLLGLIVLLPFRLYGAAKAPVVVSLFMQLRQPGLMVSVGLWVTSSMLSFLLIAFVQASGWLFRRVWRRANTAASRAAGEEVAVERRHFLQTATYAAGALPFVMVGYGFLLGRQRYTVEEVTVSIPNLPPGLDGLRLLQLTDVHASAYMPVREIRRIVGLAGELEADLVIHTGDFLTTVGDPLEEAIAELARVEGRYGGFGCLGNHEIYAVATDAATEICARHGIRILRGESATVEIEGARLNVIGVDYQWEQRRQQSETGEPHFLREAEPLVRRDGLNILLSHNPNAFPRAAELGIDLTLAGHTHGGQVQVEILDSRCNPARFFTPFVSGLYQQGASRLYVSRGLGTVGAPIRLNSPPEITLLTLRRPVAGA